MYKDVFDAIDVGLGTYYCKEQDYKEGLARFQRALEECEGEERKGEIRLLHLKNLLKAADDSYNNKNYSDAAKYYREALEYSNCPIAALKNAGLCFKALEIYDIAYALFKKFSDEATERGDIDIYLGDIEYSFYKNFPKAIAYYERAINVIPENYSIYNMLGHLYSTYYKDRYKEKQLAYFEKAYALAPDNKTVVKNLAYVYGKFHDTKNADRLYEELMLLNPSHADLHSYGAYLVRHERFKEGFRFLRHRFQKEDLGNIRFPDLFSDTKKEWKDGVDLSNKHLLIHFEQGFGDTMMFSRFLDQAKEKCAKVSLVVQSALVELYKDSNLGVDIYEEKDVQFINFDYWIPMMDLPILCETTSTTIPRAEGFLNVPYEKVQKYYEQYINKNEKFKIGIAYEGTLSSKETDRDILLSYFYPLMQLPNVEVYCFQVDDLTNQMDSVPPECHFVKLGPTFKNWEDTACAMKCMDLMISTDNGVMNLAGALGVKTFGLFNTITEWRWFNVQGEDIVWYKSIKPFQCPESGSWDVVMNQVLSEINKITG